MSHILTAQDPPAIVHRDPSAITAQDPAPPIHRDPPVITWTDPEAIGARL